MGSASKGVDRACSNCGDVFTAYGHRIDLDTIYCCRECMMDDKRATRECANCGSEFEILKSELENGRENAGRYCSSECMDEWRSENWVGEVNPLTIDSPVDCEQCGETFQKRPAKIEVHDKHFCCRECHGAWLSENNTGENHPRWSGGHRDYGEEWYAARRKALERDNETCQDCHRHADELDRAPHVHHIQPVRTFENVSDAHELRNLVVLCQSCHSKWEGWGLRPDTGG